MDGNFGAARLLAQEARAMLTRLARVKPFALYEPMVPAAGISPGAQVAIENFLAVGRRELRGRINSYLQWLHDHPRVRPEEAQRRFTFLRMRFNDVLSQFDTFDDVLTQRSEHDTGVWLSGLDVVAADALRPAIQAQQTEDAPAWRFWERWISEIVSDLWSVSKVGITSTLGLMGVVSLPRPFVFRVSLDDPHPIPWIRVKLSCAMGDALYPHTQWRKLAAIWEQVYPQTDLPEERRMLLAVLEQTMPAFVSLLVNHRPPALRGASLIEVLTMPDRRPEQLAAEYAAWRVEPERMRRIAPALAFTVIGQARADGRLSPEGEGRMLTIRQ